MKKEKGTKKKGGCLKTIFIVLGVFIVIGIIASIGGENNDKNANKKPESKNEEQAKPNFEIQSTDAIGVAERTLVNDEKMPAGKYEIVCKEGHGVVTINDNGYVLGTDEYKGKEYGSEIFKKKRDAVIAANASIKVRNFNSSDFKVEFYFIEKTSEEEQPQEDIPSEYTAALKKAQVYSDTMYMSKQGIYDQLTSEYGEKFPTDAAQYAIDNLQTDYNRNALEKARVYQTEMAMSKEAIKEQLISENGEKFTPEEADYAINNLE